MAVVLFVIACLFFGHQVKATSKCEYVEWKIHELREQVKMTKKKTDQTLSQCALNDWVDPPLFFFLFSLFLLFLF